MQITDIDWNDPKAKISKYFTVKEALYLPSWGVLHIPSDREKEAILKTAEVMDLIRDYMEHPVNVHCWIRPIYTQCKEEKFNGKNYNLYVRGAPSSAHIEGIAVDFSVSTVTADNARLDLLPKLEALNIRMEDLPGAGWVHIDLRKPISKRFFKP